MTTGNIVQKKAIRRHYQEILGTLPKLERRRNGD